MNIPPQKPWESGGGNSMVNSRFVMNNAPPQIQSTYQNIPTRLPLQSSSHLTGNIRTVGPPPPLPPRSNTLQYPVQRQSNYYGGGYGMPPYSSGYGMRGYGGYNNYGGFNGYGGLGGYGMSGLGYGFGQPMSPMNDFESRFIQLAEESSRPAFQSIESLVRAFSSVSMMLESTFHAMYSSFRAVIGVAENFSRLRQLFAQFFSAIAVLKFAKNFLRRLLYWFGIVPDDPSKETLWQNVQNGQTEWTAVAPSRAVWPVFAFLGLLFGGPYLMSKLLGQPITGTDKENTWNPQEEPGMSVISIHPFQAASDSEISFQRGQMLQLAPLHYHNVDASNGWLLAADHQSHVGFIPSNRVARLPKTARGNAPNVQRSVNTSVPIQNEVDPLSAPETEKKVNLPSDQDNMASQ